LCAKKIKNIFFGEVRGEARVARGREEAGGRNREAGGRFFRFGEEARGRFFRFGSRGTVLPLPKPFP